MRVLPGLTGTYAERLVCGQKLSPDKFTRAFFRKGWITQEVTVPWQAT